MFAGSLAVLLLASLLAVVPAHEAAASSHITATLSEAPAFANAPDLEERALQNNGNSGTVRVTLSGAYFTDRTTDHAGWGATGLPGPMSVTQISFENFDGTGYTSVWADFQYSGADFDDNRNLQLTIPPAGHTGSGTITTATINVIAYQEPAVPPGAPTNLRYDKLSDQKLTDQNKDPLRWNPPSSDGGAAITHYEVRRRQTDLSNWETTFTNTGSPDTTYNINKASWSVGYFYQVRAVNNSGAGGWSNQIRIGGRPTWKSGAAGTPTATSSTSEVALTFDWINKLSFDGGKDIDEYRYRYKKSSASDWTTVADLPASTTSVTLTDSVLDSNTAYDFDVIACNEDRCSYTSPDAAATTLNFGATIDSTSPDPLTEAAGLDDSTVTVDLVGGLQYEQSLQPSHFTLNTDPTISGLSVASGGVAREGNTRVVLTLDHDGSDFHGDPDVDLTVTVKAAALQSFTSDLTTAEVTIETIDPPGQPGNVALIPGDGQLGVTWSAATNANGYKVQWKSGLQEFDSSRENTPTNPGTTQSPHVISGLNNGTDYTVRVIATRTDAPDGDPSEEATETPNETGTVLDLSAAAGTDAKTQVNLSWTAPTDTSYADYYWQSKQASAGSYSGNANHTSAPRATASSLTVETDYDFRVRACQSASNTNANCGPWVEVSHTTAPAVSVPDPPTNVRVTGSGITYTISWDAPDDGGSPIQGYRAEFYSHLTFSWGTSTNLVTTASVTTASYTANQLTPQTRWRVVALNDLGESDPSAEATVAPFPVRNLKATGGDIIGGLGNNVVRLNFDVPTSEGASAITKYQYRFRAYGGDEGQTAQAWGSAADIALSACSGGSCQFDGATVASTGVAHDFEVWAVNASGEGPRSTVRIGKRPNGPNAATQMRAANIGGTALTLEWDLPADLASGVNMADATSWNYRYREEPVGHSLGAGQGWTNRNTRGAADPAARSVRITGLDPGTRYGFQVEAQTAQRDGWWSASFNAETLNVSATIASTNPDRLSERNLDGAVLSVDLTGVEYRPAGDLQQSHFTLSQVTGLTLDSFNRVDDDTVELTLAYDGTSIIGSASVTVTVAMAATTHTADLTTGAVSLWPNSWPEFTNPPATLSVDENVVKGTDVGAAFAATDADGDTLEWTVGGTDGGNFVIDQNGQLATDAHLDFETKSSHSLVISLFDGVGSTVHNVTVNVNDLNDTGDSSLTPTAGDDPTVARKSRATYTVTLTGLWDDTVTPNGVPAGEHFTTFAGAVHNDEVMLVGDVSAGVKASAGLELLAETGIPGTLANEVAPHVTSGNADRYVSFAAPGAEPGDANNPRVHADVVLTSDHPRITLFSMIAPTPDWFVGIAGLRLLKTDGTWETTKTIDLYPWDAGTEDDDVGFSLAGNDADPKVNIESIRGKGEFTGLPIARIAFARTALETAPVAPTGVTATRSETSTAVTVGWTAVTADATATGYTVEYATSSSGPWTEGATADGDDTSAEVSGLGPNTVYFFRVRAETQHLEGAWSDGTATATTINVSASITATSPATLTEENLNGAKVTVVVAGATYESESVLRQSGRFTFNPASIGGGTLGVSQVDRSGSDTAVLTLSWSGNLSANASFQVSIAAEATTHTGVLTTDAVTVGAVTDYDADDDGLIEITNLDQLNAIRWDLDADGSSSNAGYATAFPFPEARMGCPSTGCIGYELKNDLDFDENNNGMRDDTYNQGSGWAPIYGRNFTQRFSGTFEGNGFTISNLFISRNEIEVGLFGYLDGTLRNVGLLDVNVTNGSTAGAQTGALASQIVGTVSGVFVTGQVTGSSSTGGIAGRLFSFGTVTGDVSQSWSSADVHAPAGVVGGLFGAGLRGSGGSNPRVSDSYATGTVTSAMGNTSARGGLAGSVIGTDIARVLSTASTNGKGATDRAGSGTAGYFDSDAAGLTDVSGAKTETELRSGTPSAGVYTGWDADDVWDFGNTNNYPVLRAPAGFDRDWRDTDGTASGPHAGFGDQREPQPPSLSAAGSVSGGITVTWTAPSTQGIGPLGEYIARVATDGGSFSDVATQPGASVTTYSITADSSAFSKAFELRATNASAHRRSAPARIGPPGAPDLTLVPGNEQIVASWSEPDDGGSAVTTRTLSYKTDPNPFTVENGVSSPHTIRNLTNGADYDVEVVLHNIMGRGAAATAMATPMEIGATVSPATVDEADLNGQVLTITLSGGATFNAGVAPRHFSLMPAVDGLSLGTPTRTSPTTVTIPLAFVAAGNDLTMDVTTNIQIQGFATTTSDLSAPITLRATRTDYDTDDDGLIEINWLEQLDAVRYELSGDGTAETGFESQYAAAFPLAEDGMGCAFDHDGDSGTPERCIGYELVRDLDFNSRASYRSDTVSTAWTTGTGWAPIGAVVSYTGTFQGNGKTISNLFVNDSTTGVGLFNRLAGTLTNLGLVNVNVTGDDAGALAADSSASITGVYATGRVSASGNAGGLVGSASPGSITSSYSTVAVTGSGDNVGGLVGSLGFTAATISNSYATGPVNGADNVGGLVGEVLATGTITNSYATGAVSGTGANVGGLAGSNAGTVTASYYDTETTGQSGGTGPQSTEALITPTSNTGIFSGWDSAVWNFSRNNGVHYPALIVDFDGNGSAGYLEFGYQIRTGPVLTLTADADGAQLSWTRPSIGSWSPGPTLTEYQVFKNGEALGSPIRENFGPTSLTYTDATFDPATELDAKYYVSFQLEGANARTGNVESFGVPSVTDITFQHITEADTSAGGITLELSRALLTDESVIVTFRALDTSGLITDADFNETVVVDGTTGNTVTADPSGTSVRVPLTAVDDNIFEPAEVSLQLTIAGIQFRRSGGNTDGSDDVAVSIAAGQVTQTFVNLLDNEVAPTSIVLSVSPNSVNEADADTATPATTVTVTASFNTGAGALGSSTAVTVAIGGGSGGAEATEGTDYDNVADITVTIAAGATSATGTFSITPMQDTASEGNETVTVSGTTTLSGVTVMPATLTILDDDQSASIFATDPSPLTEAAGLNGRTVTVDLSAAEYVSNLQASHFELITSPAIPGLSHTLVARDANDVRAVLALVHDGSDFHGNPDVALSVRVLGAGLVSLTNNLDTTAVTIETIDPPGKPGTVALISGDRKLGVTWGAATDATGYKVQWKSGSEEFDSSREDTPTNPGTAQSPHEITGLLNGTEYTVRVIATRTDAPDGDPSDTMPAETPIGPPGTPTIDEVTLLQKFVLPTLDRVRLDWSAPADNGGRELTCYQLQYSANADLTTHSGNNVLQTYFEAGEASEADLNVVSLLSTRAYYFQLRVTNTPTGPCGSGQVGWSGWSATFSLPAAPGTVQNLMAVGGERIPGVDDATTVRLTWDAQAGADSYRILARTVPGSFGESGTETDTDHDATGLTAGSDYEFQVVALANGRASLGTFLKVSGQPAAPQNLSATGSDSSTNVSLTWDEVAIGDDYAPTDYRMQYRPVTTPPSDWVDAADTAARTDNPTGTVRGLQPATVYEFRVRAETAHRDGDWSVASNQVTTPNIGAAISATDPDPLTEENLHGAMLTVGLVGLSWVASLNENSVTVSGVPGATVRSVVRDSEDTARAVVTLDYDFANNDLAADASLALTVDDDAAGHTENVPAGSVTVEAVTDYDVDDDGLIEIANLDQLNAIRWDLDGDGSSSNAGYATAFPDAAMSMGCPDTDDPGSDPGPCTGYELTTDLDFDSASSYALRAVNASWTTGAGWTPLGSFSTTFDGNGHTISNLHIETSDSDGSHQDASLFGDVSSGTVRNVGLVDANVSGAQRVGALAGNVSSGGRVENSYSTGTVSGRQFVGGLVGAVNSGTVTASWSSAAVSVRAFGSQTRSQHGGLVGSLSGGTVSNSYATGQVSGWGRVGGLVGRATSSARIEDSYSTGRPSRSGSNPIGGLVGDPDSVTVVNSYFDTTNSGQSHSTQGKTETELRQGFPLSGVIYDGWDVAGVWDIGNANNYPVLRAPAGFDGDWDDTDGTASGAHTLFGYQRELQPPTGLMVAAGSGGALDLSWTAPSADSTIAALNGFDWVATRDGTASSGSTVAGTTAYSLASPGVSNEFSVRATNGSAHRQSAATVLGPPGAPVGLTVVSNPDGQRLDVRWLGLGSGTDPLGWVVEHRLSGQDPVPAWTTLSPEPGPTARTAEIASLTTGQTYDVRLAARDLMGRGTYATAMATPMDVGATVSPTEVDEAGLHGQELTITLNGATFELSLQAGWFTFDPPVPGLSVQAFDRMTGTETEITLRYTGDITADGRVQIVVASNAIVGRDDELRTPPVTLRATRTDYDTDDDGLIEISTLTQLNAMRWDLNGDGMVADDTATTGVNEADEHAAAFPLARSDMGCPASGCVGYELAADLDFDQNSNGTRDDTYNQGSGWDPISSYDAAFDGNGHVIANLFIDRGTTNSVGLFGSLATSGVVRGVGLLHVDVTGQNSVGALVGEMSSGATVDRAYAIGSVTGEDSVGGLVGENSGSITRSWVAGTVTGGREMGGLVGQHNGSIIASYAAGLVRTDAAVLAGGGTTGGGTNVGGLVGRMDGSASVHASYSSAMVVNPVNPGSTAGLIGWVDDGTVENSYYDTDAAPGLNATRRRGGNAGTVTGVSGRTTAQLQAPSGYAGIYADWNVDLDSDSTGDDPWHFGTGTQYPALTADGPDAGSGATWQEFGYQVRGALRLTATPSDDGTEAVVSWTRLAAPPSQWGLGGFSYQLYVDGVREGAAGSATSFRDTLDATAERVYQVAALLDGTQVAYSNFDRAGGYDADHDGLIAVRSLAQLNAIRWDTDGNGVPTTAGATAYAAAFPVTGGGPVCPSGTCTGYELMADLDFDTGTAGVRTDDDYYNGGEGWDPIPSTSITFDGNGRTISNLSINRSGIRMGLFGELASSAEVRNVGLVNADVTGGQRVGALVGYVGGGATVTGTFATGSVTGVQWVGGMVGFHEGAITKSYTYVTVTGAQEAGGLVGMVQDDTGSVSDSYTIGQVIASSRSQTPGNNDGKDIGGLVGRVQPVQADRPTVGTSYSAAVVKNSVQPASTAGLVGLLSDGVLRNSYYDTGATPDTDTSDADLDTTAVRRASGMPGTVTNVSGQSAAALQAPTSAAGIYSTWSGGVWDFGTSTQYPALKVDFNGDGTATWEEFGFQVRENLAITGAAVSQDLSSVSLGWEAATDAWAAATLTHAVFRDSTRIAPAEGATLTPRDAYTDSTVTADETYSYEIALLVDGVEYRRSTARSVTVIAPPGAPTGVGVTAGSGDEFTLSWNAPAGTVDSYTWEHRPAGSGAWVEGGTGVTAASVTATITGLATAAREFRVRAVNAAGDGENSAAVLLAGPPGAVQGLDADGREVVRLPGGTIRLRWDAVTGAATGGKPITGYDYERRPAGSGSFGNAGSTTGTQVDIGGLGDNANYDFQVRAKNADRVGPWTMLTVSGRPSAPGGVAATASTTSTDVTVTWNAVTAGTPIVSYRVQYKLPSESTSAWDTRPAVVVSAPAPGQAPPTTATVSGLEASTEYEFRLRADTAHRWGWSSSPNANSRVTTAAVGASITATDPSPLGEAAVGRPGGAALTLRLAGVTFARSVTAGDFSVTADPAVPSGARLWISAANAGSGDSEAALTLRLTGDLAADTRVSVTVAGGAHTGADALTTAPVTVTATRTVTLSVTPNPLDEGASATVTATVVPAPAADVTLTVSAAAASGANAAETGDFTLTGTTLTVPAGETGSDVAGSPSRSVTIAANDDGDSDDERVTVSATVSGGHAAPAAVTLTIDDDDDPGITVAAADPLTLTEGHATDASKNYTVVLDTQPSGDVVINVRSSDTGAATVQPASLTFTGGAGGNWATPQTVTVTAADDPDAADESLTVTHAVNTGQTADVDYDRLSALASVNVAVDDDETVGVTVSTAAVSVQEDGSAAWTVVLDAQPTANVRIAVAIPDEDHRTALRVTPAALVFTPSNWDTPKTVTVHGRDDPDSDHEAVTVTHAVVAASSADEYASVTVASVTATLADNDTPGIRLSGTPTRPVAEGRTVSYTVRLNTAPSGNVVVRITSDNADVTVDTDTGTVGNQDTLTFTLTGSTAWNRARTVRLTAGRDDDAADDRAVITHAVDASVSADEYDSVAASAFEVNVNDADTPGITVDSDPDTPGVQRGRIDVDEGSTAVYSVVLDAQPTANVVVDVSVSAAVGVSVQPTRLTFTPGNWSTAQVVTVTAAEDQDNSADENVTLTHSVVDASSADEYDDVADVTRAVRAVDNDVPGLTLGALTPAQIAEQGSATYSVKLNVGPTSDVVVRIFGSGDVTVDTDPNTGGDQDTLTFTRDNWSVDQTVTLRAAHDDDAADDAALIRHRVVDGRSAAEYRSVADKTFTATVADDETAGVTIDTDPGTDGMQDDPLMVAEGGTATYTIVLDVQPTGTVRIDISSSSPAISVQPASVSFNAANWDRPRTVTLQGVRDANAVREQATISHTINAGSSVDEFDAVVVTTQVTATAIDDATAVDYDLDDDGRIEITSRAQLNAVRWDLDGDGVADDPDDAVAYARAFPRVMQNMCGAAFVAGTSTEGHPGGCTGYELVDNIRLSGSWLPIGGDTPRTEYQSDSIAVFSAVFDGNGHTISGLQISRGNSRSVGLFGAIGAGAAVRDVGLVGASVRGFSLVGALVGQNRGTVSGSYSTGQVWGNSLVGGLVGWNRSAVERSWSEADVTGFNTTERDSPSGALQPVWSTQLGGLVGANYSRVANTYSTGRVRGAGHVAGLAGLNNGGGVITNSYTISPVTLDFPDWPNGGGLIGWRLGPVSASYWNTDSSGQADAVGQGGEEGIGGHTTAELQAPRSARGIYAYWSDCVWDFGTSRQYPRLRAGADNCPADQPIQQPEQFDTVANRRASITVTADVPLTVNEGASADYTVVLDEQPTGDVTVYIASDNPDVTTDPEGLLFTPDDWDTPQTVTVQAGHDGDTADDTATLSHDVVGADEYSGIAVDAVAVAVVDDDTAGVVVKNDRVTLPEGWTGSYSLSLTHRPAGNVEIHISSTNPDVKPYPDVVTFTPDNWQTKQLIGLPAAHDDDTDDDQAFILHALLAGPETGYANVEVAPVIVTVTDDDTETAEEEDDDQQADGEQAEGEQAGGQTQPEAQAGQQEDQQDTESDIDGEQAGGESGTDTGPQAQAAQQTEPAGDRDILQALYNATGGAGWTSSANWLTEQPLGEWHGVTTDAQGRVTGLSLRDNNLTGTLPAAIGGLAQLEVLSLDRNRIGGSLPAELGNLSRLTRLALNRNSLTGAIPAELGSLSSLSTIGLARNQLSGTLPTALGSLSSLTKLSLHDNTALSGPLPAGFGTIAGLSRLAVSRTGLSGTLPQGLTNSAMRYLHFDDTGLCAPADSAFQTWLAGVTSHNGATCDS